MSNLFDDEPIERHGSPLGVLLGLSAGTRLSTLVEKGWKKARRRPAPTAPAPEPAKPGVEGLIDSLLGMSLDEMREALKVEPAPVQLSTVTPPAPAEPLLVRVVEALADRLEKPEVAPDPAIAALSQQVAALEQRLQPATVKVERKVVRDGRGLVSSIIETHAPESAEQNPALAQIAGELTRLATRLDAPSPAIEALAARVEALGERIAESRRPVVVERKVVRDDRGLVEKIVETQAEAP